MTNNDILRRFDRVNVWKKFDQRAPHKPLLILYALGRWQRGLREVTFREAEPELTALLKRFGRPRRSDHPEQPFWRLQRNQVWVVRSPNPLPLKKGDKNPLVGALRSPDVRAGFTPEVLAALDADRTLARRIARRVLTRHFPDSYHEDILDAVGLGLTLVLRRKRDPKFRERVIDAYEGRCAVCRFEVRVAGVLVALDAAHIRWHQYDGPSTESNGLALCSLHHKLFDYGAFTVREGRVLVSTKATGNDGFERQLMTHHGGRVWEPRQPDWRPDSAHLEWHGREVFKGEARRC
jgi:putative restriction endonuclease